MNILILKLIFLLPATIYCQHDEYFSSLLQLEELAKLEGEFIEKLETIVNHLNSEDYFRTKLNYWKFEHRLLQQDVAKYIENPLNAFAMIKRATVDISLLMNRLPSSEGNELARYRIKDLSLTDAVKSLLLVQRIYKLSSNDIARGYIHNYHIGDQMTPYDLYAIGNAACNITNEEFFAKKYLEIAYENYQNGHDTNNEIDEKELVLKIAKLCERMNDYKCSAFYLKKALTIDPDDDESTEYAMRIVKLYKKYGSKKITFDHPYKITADKDGQYSRRKEFELISDVCRGKLTKTALEKSKLRCRYISSSPFTKLAPFKIEEVNLNPYIVMYLNVLSNNEIQSLKNVTMRTTQRNSKRDADEKSIFDVIRMVSLYDDNNELTARISRRIEDMTGLSVDAMEPLNAENFGVAGPVWKESVQQQKGNKMAMILFYMNDDHIDGYTVFPYLKVKIIPREGSALFWFTLKSSGQQEYGTRFSQCPVLYRSKWIAFKNIYERGQEFRRPCSSSEGFVPTRINDYDNDVF